MNKTLWMTNSKMGCTVLTLFTDDERHNNSDSLHGGEIEFESADSNVVGSTKNIQII